MTTQDLKDQLLLAFTEEPGNVLLLGLTPTALELRAWLRTIGIDRWLIGIAEPGIAENAGIGVLDWTLLNKHAVDYLVVASDEDKEDLLQSYVRDIGTPERLPRVILAGTAHLAFHNDLYAEMDAPALVPSYATGYPHTRIHIFQHLCAAARNRLSGAIVEFGAFKGGTTGWLARLAKRLDLPGPILAFDSWGGFPPRRSVLDMYTHPRCVFTDLSAVKAYLEPLGVEVVPGDITDTAPLYLQNLPVLLAFIDTDNYSPAAAALSVLVDNIVPGGAIVFDHYTTTPDYIYTLGERMAGTQILGDSRFLHVHGTGIFLRLPTAEDLGSPSSH